MKTKSSSDYKSLEEKLEFNRIRRILEEQCLFLPGIEKVRQIQWVSDPTILKNLIQKTNEFRSILIESEPFPSSNYFDLRPYLDKIKPVNSFLDEEEMWKVCLALLTFRDVYSFFENRQEKYPSLWNAFPSVSKEWDWVATIQRKFNETGKLRDNASSELAAIRKEKSKTEGLQNRVIEKSFKDAMKAGMVPDGASIAVRNGRTVIPIMAEYKRKVRGIIHDLSSTGSTVFIEPDAVIEASNQYQELLFREKREIEKILREMTAQVRRQGSLILQSLELLGEMDYTRAKAKLAISLGAVQPGFSESPEVKIIQGRHPVFLLQLQKKIVPLNVELDNQRWVVLISGPNAGGKSVALKTVGLLQYMYQCGLLVPVDESSRFGIFKHIYLDIGDQQSIENDLSTYSSHLKSMLEVLQNGNEDSLVLIDEMGSGTEPKLGASIAEAILEGILSRKCKGVITTHYSNLKHFAEVNDHIENAAMLFDKKNLTPFYILEQGRQGGSFALEVAEKIGLPREILQRSKELAGSDIVSLEEILARLDNERYELERKTENLERAEGEARTAKAKYDELKKQLDEKREFLLKEAAQKADLLIRETNKEIEKTIRHIKENKAEKKETRRIRGKLRQYQQSIPSIPDNQAMREKRLDFKPHDRVRLIGKDVIGEIIDIKNREASVLVGSIKTKVPLNQLEHTDEKITEKKHKTGYQISRSAVEISNKIDIRGKRAEEAILMVEKFLDNAMIAGFSQLTILHGKGDGILRKVIRDYLRRMPFVAKYEDEHIESGGDGITLVTLK